MLSRTLAANGVYADAAGNEHGPTRPEDVRRWSRRTDRPSTSAGEIRGRATERPRLGELPHRRRQSPSPDARTWSERTARSGALLIVSRIPFVLRHAPGYGGEDEVAREVRRSPPGLVEVEARHARAQDTRLHDFRCDALALATRTIRSIANATIGKATHFQKTGP